MSRFSFFGSSHVGQDNVPNLGGEISTYSITDAPILHRLYDAITGQQSYAGNYTDYRCFFVQNTSDASVKDLRIYILNKQPDVEQVTLAIGLDPSGIDTPARTVVDEVTAPTGVTFLEGVGGVETTAGHIELIDGKYLTLSELSAGSYFAIWLKRHTDVNRTHAQLEDGITIQIMASASVG